MDLRGKTAVITGAARGLGAAMAKSLAGQGTNLALIDLALEDLEETQRACVATGVTARAYSANVADESAVVDAFAAIASDFGRLDAMVANAGILRDGLLVKARDGEIAGSLSLADWQAVIDVNLTGVFLCGREATRQMIGFGNGGCIINISSISRHGNFGQSNYSAAKAGVAALAVVWSKELARHGIRANAVAPGFVRTEILSSMKPELLQKMTAGVPAGRLGEPEEVAHAVEYILRNDYVNGSVIDIDGGLRL